MTRDEALLTYSLRLGDNALILGQRLIELVAGEPELEEELANANFALDFIGQARMFYDCAGALEGKGRKEDDFAFLRDSQEFQNLLLVEQPTVHFGDKIVRSVLFESFYMHQLEALTRCSHESVSEVAARGVKEIRYHLRHNSQWLVRLGDGTEESHARVQASLNELWQFTGEMFAGDRVDDIVHAEFNGPDLEVISRQWHDDLRTLLDEATLTMPGDQWMASGGRQGRHSEHHGLLIAEMQHLQRACPGATW